MKKAVFWDVAPCRCGVNGRFGVTYRLHLQCRMKNKKIPKQTVGTPVLTVYSLADFLMFPSTLKMEAIHSSETSVNTTSTRCHIPEVCFIHIKFCRI
jgi:hypothetical protein